MKSTMQQTPLLISTMLRFGTTAHASSEVITWTEAGPSHMTYGELGRVSAQLANALRGLGVTGDQRVGTFMWNNAEHLAAYLAVPSMGAVLHALNIRLFPEQIAYVTNHGGSEVVIVDDSLAEPFAKLLPNLTNVRHVIVNGTIPDALRDSLGQHAQVHDWSTLLNDQPTTFEWVSSMDENDASSLCYTSGTTGNPKGVAYSHRSNYLHALAGTGILHWSAADRLLIVVPLFHANAWGFPYMAMLSGSTLIMPGRHLQAEPLATMIERLRITGGAGVPTIWADLLRYLTEHPDADASTVQRLVVGGSAAPESMMRRYQDELGIEVIHAWGMTETSPMGSVALPPPGISEGTDEYWRYRSSQGRLLASVEGRIVGPDGAEQPRDGVGVGELEIRGPWIAGSYITNEGDSQSDIDNRASSFTPDGWFRTGDVGALTPDLFLRLTDRSKDVIKSGGEWISSVELENHIMAHPDVVEASVVNIPDEKWGERPLAAVVLRQGSTITTADLRKHLSANVARWQLPERWTLIEEVPKTSVGKFDKKRLRERYAAGDLRVEQPEDVG